MRAPILVLIMMRAPLQTGTGTCLTAVQTPVPNMILARIVWRMPLAAGAPQEAGARVGQALVQLTGSALTRTGLGIRLNVFQTSVPNMTPVLSVYPMVAVGGASQAVAAGQAQAQGHLTAIVLTRTGHGWAQNAAGLRLHVIMIHAVIVPDILAADGA
jgi:hypothetical protein